MAAVWWIQLSLVLLVSKFATGTKPTFRCEDEGASYTDNCGGIGNYHDMNGFDIAETDDLNKVLYTLAAFDPDDESSPVTFEILPWTGTLFPGQGNGIHFLNVGSLTGNVTPKVELDYETFHRLWFKWKLTDQDGETFTSGPIVVFITDINDNDPEFTSSSYRLEAIEEGSKTPDDILVTVNATDRDTGDDIKYDIVDSHLGWPCNGGIFKIDPSTGGISLKVGETLDFETSTLYTICVRASDSGAPVGEPRYAYAQVIISIQDVQDEPPNFTKTNYDQEIPEDAPVGSDVVEVLAREGDRGVLVPNLILYSLTGGDDKFEIGNSTGQITIKELLDRETKTSYIVTVVAQEIHADGTLQAPPSSAEVTITIQLLISQAGPKPLCIFSKPASQSSSHSSGLFPAGNAVDGSLSSDMAHCSHTVAQSLNPWWRVGLGEDHCISKVEILNRGDCCSERLAGAVVRAGDSTTVTDNPACGSPVTAAQAQPLGGTIAFDCSPALRARYVSVDIPGTATLQLCEVTVQELPLDQCSTSFDIVGKPASQSSSHGSGNFPAGNAVDGSPSSDMAHCSHTVANTMNPWWKVDLEEEQCVTKVTILNRGDCCSERLEGAQVRAGMSGTVTQNAACGAPVTSSQAQPLGGTIEIDCDKPLRARYVSVDIPGTATLQLCEVYVDVLLSSGNC